MRKQILKAATMFVGIIALAFVSALAASAQSSRSIAVNIPFEFSVKGATLPAGEYLVKSTVSTDQMTLIIQRRDGKSNAMVLTQNVQGAQRQNETRLVFNRYGEHYFLSQVWTEGDKEGRQLFKTKQERSIGIELAKNNSQPETIVLVARLQ